MIEDPNFSLILGPPWRRIESVDPLQYSFTDDDRGILIVISAVTHKGVRAGGLDRLVDLIAELKMRAEVDAARIFGNPASFCEPIIVPQPWGRAVAYYGNDAAGRQFGYSGAITRDRTINLYMLSRNLPERSLFETMDDVFSRILFDRTPLEAEAADG